MIAIFRIIDGALKDSGATLGDVVSTRLFASNIGEDWEELGAAHAEIFSGSGAKPACTLVGGELLMDWMKVEVECTAMIP